MIVGEGSEWIGRRDRKRRFAVLSGRCFVANMHGGEVAEYEASGAMRKGSEMEGRTIS